jgi:redox-sensing transcriptional repressor
MADGRLRRIPEATVARLPVYWRALLELADARTPTVSSEMLAEMAGENAAKVRKDLSYLGTYGTRGAGYDVHVLTTQIGHELGLNEDWPVVIVGVGNLGRALANYRGFSTRGFRVAALVDDDPVKVGQVMGGLVVSPVDDLPALVERERLAIGLIATPAPVAQGVADRLVAAGVTSLLNFAPAVLTTPAHVLLRQVDLSIELQILSFYERHPLEVAVRRPRTVGQPVGGDGRARTSDRPPGPAVSSGRPPGPAVSSGRPPGPATSL